MNPRVLEITPIEGHKLKLLFDNGEQRFYDCSGLLDFGVFQELQDKSYFTDVTHRSDYGLGHRDASTPLRSAQHLLPKRLPMRNISYFRKAKVVDGTVVWSHGQDVCPDTLYLDSVKDTGGRF